MNELISLAEYAKLHGVTQDAIRHRVHRGALKAKKIGRNWVIDKDEPYIDDRIKSGKYKDWRKKGTES